jgi:hypothetical protein
MLGYLLWVGFFAIISIGGITYFLWWALNKYDEEKR